MRSILTGLAALFALFLALRGLVWVGGAVDQPIAYLLMTVLYLGTVGLCLLVTSGALPEAGPDADEDVGEMLTTAQHGPARLPQWVLGIALAMALSMPNVIALSVAPASRTAPFGTWYVGAIGLLMTIVMVRRRPWTAWIGVLLLALSTMLWIGVLPALSLGLIGSAVWVLAAQLLVMGMDRAARDTSRLAQLQRTASAWRAAQRGRQRERRVQVQRALAVAGPILSRAIERSGELSEQERVEARIAEGQLRDELRGGRLLDDGVRAELDAARRRGATVIVLDEGGLDDLDEAQLGAIRALVAGAVHDAHSDRLFIRASTHPQIAVTVVGRSARGGALSDEDTVDLWREIARP
ncbi:hypothetical protein [Microbacterium kribbense]|uniref:hypothetical protein n=1 Tax=Microbacterium kribbense TaxID=433645 RepID=UPI0031CFF5D6